MNSTPKHESRGSPARPHVARMERPGQPSPARAAAFSPARPAAPASGLLGCFRNGYCSHSSHFLLVFITFSATSHPKIIPQLLQFPFQCFPSISLDPYLKISSNYTCILSHFTISSINHSFFCIFHLVIIFP